MKFKLVVRAKKNSQTYWVDLSVGGRSDLRQSLFFLISHNLCLWQQMVLLWTAKLPAIHYGGVLGMNILIRPDHATPSDLTQKKKRQNFCSGPGYQLEKEPVRTTSSTGHNRRIKANTRLRNNALKKTLFRLNKHKKQVMEMSNKWVTKHSLSN